jgi:hypothetical protein
MSLDDDWHYLPTRTRAGALQRGLGRGAVRARHDPAAPELIYACIRRDHRWLPLDDRGVYLARLVRDLKLPTGPIVARLFAATAETGEFSHVLRVSEALGRAGCDGIVESLRRYVRIGPHWREALSAIAGSWPANWWDDLLPAAADRLAAGAQRAIDRPVSPPWPEWSRRDERIRVAVGRAFAGPADEPESAGDCADCLAGPAPDALPAARRVAADPDSGPYWRSLRVLAQHGDESDAPALIAGLDWLDRRTDDLCGYDRLVDGLARIGGDEARRALPRIRTLWFSPHSYERAAYLRARLALEPDPAACAGALTEALWDCEADVRLLGVRHVALDAKLERRLAYLRDDPIETAGVRAAAAERLDLEAAVR